MDMKPIAPHLHGCLDYATVLLFLAAPALMGLTGAAAGIAYVLAGVHALMTLITDFPLGAARVLPLAYHGWDDRLVGPALIVLPFALGFDARARIFYLAMGITIVLVGWLSNYQETAR